MHISDGVLSPPWVIGTSIIGLGLTLYSLKGVKEEDIPKISLMTAGFFSLSMISISIGPTSAHPLLVGLLGIILRKKAFISLFVALILQAILFSHGGITSLGANLLLVGVPAVFTGYLFHELKSKINIKLLSCILGSLGVILVLFLLSIFLYFSSDRFSSIIKVLIFSHIPIIIIEGVMTLFATTYINKVKPSVLVGEKLNVKT